MTVIWVCVLLRTLHSHFGHDDDLKYPPSTTHGSRRSSLDSGYVFQEWSSIGAGLEENGAVPSHCAQRTAYLY